MKTLPQSKLPGAGPPTDANVSLALAETGPQCRTTGRSNRRSALAANWLSSVAWLFYPMIGLEILFMISPAALYFYSLYGPVLNVLDSHAATSWLTRFFLPHLSTTRSDLLNVLPAIGGLLAVAGAAWFIAAASQIYRAKLDRRGLVTTGLYRFSRHPQYTALAVFGLGVLLMWPRFLVLIAYVLMLFLYRALASLEERQCLGLFGDAYRDYQARTRPILPLPPPPAGAGGPLARLDPERIPALPLAATLLAVLFAFGLREYSLSSIAAVYDRQTAVLSPAPLGEAELRAAFGAALGDSSVRQALIDAGDGPLVVHVVPREWHLADLPLEVETVGGGHETPANFDRSHYKLLFSRARSHRPWAAGRDILRSTYGLSPFLLARVDLSTGAVTATETPPAHVLWGDIPTPLF